MICFTFKVPRRRCRGLALVFYNSIHKVKSANWRIYVHMKQDMCWNLEYERKATLGHVNPMEVVQLCVNSI